MVMIGANGAGKTSVLETISLLSASAEGKLNFRLNEMGGIASVLTQDRADESGFLVDMEVPHFKPLKYELHLAAKGLSHAVSTEVLSQERGRGPGPFTHIESHYGDVRYFEIKGNRLVRPRDANRILQAQGLLVSANACPELKALLTPYFNSAVGTSLLRM